LHALSDLGWAEEYRIDFEPHAAAGLLPARVAAQHRGAYVLLSELGELRAEPAGRLAHLAAGAADLPAVGDWVAVAPRPAEGAATIHHVLPRRTSFSRKTAWQATEEQVLAANVDTVFLVMSLNEDFNLRRLERYLTTAWESGAQPVVLLTKIDLCPEWELRALEVEAIALGVPVHAVSALTGDGIEAVRSYLSPGHTVALLGSSGVGKSTLVNTLAGEELLATAPVREDDGEGRHTTRHRQLVPLPDGGLVLDTPGLRELQLWEASGGLSESFADVEELAARCRFSDCAHGTEPGCAVQAALEDGSLPHDRWASYRKLERELAHLERRLDKRLQAEERKRWAKVGAEGKARSRAKRGG
jgi:ribosome biogenesis GTPase / thiamine phosphate phosphatase